jgi:hypothetical protein
MASIGVREEIAHASMPNILSTACSPRIPLMNRAVKEGETLLVLNAGVYNTHAVGSRSPRPRVHLCN